ncbi:efflux RND transporter periplasmic adaptor subunit [Paraburkholderia fynbosensis]|uniref:Multidrug resistance protein MdtA n=1 Tax=Paraburkholderia fynbosensis TaxID=1200993 RepID=A0A6J5H0W2_9BURK|nr:efflux RND transporter periplasmic adaptor subunit [Paraburkholderia fynbosensis]CAB3809798.1 Multidrug resistance protein MdtA [Paraburkholderia fynbosensis]
MSQSFTTRIAVFRRRAATRRRLVTTAIVLALLAALGAGVALMRSRPADVTPAPAASALTVALLKPQHERWSKSIDVSGAIAPWQEATIRSLVTGARLSEVRVDVGDAVRRGEVLARYDTALLQAEAAQMAAALAQAEASAQQARTNEARALQMKDSGGISRQDLLQYRTTAAVTKAQVDVARAQLQARRLDLRNASVLAPDDGTISARAATLGSVTPVGQELFRLIRQDRLQWQAEVTAADVAAVKPDQHVLLALPDGSHARGMVRRIAPSLDPQSRVAIVYADLEPGSHARAGMYAGGRIVLGDSDALVVPASALAMLDGRSHVAVVAERGGVGRVTLREVQTGRRESSSVEIVSGVADTEHVAREGAALLNEGDFVTLAPGVVSMTGGALQ